MSTSATTRGVGSNINGQRSSGTEILLDGVENIDLFTDSVGIVVPVDALAGISYNDQQFYASVRTRLWGHCQCDNSCRYRRV